MSIPTGPLVATFTQPQRPIARLRFLFWVGLALFSLFMLLRSGGWAWLGPLVVGVGGVLADRRRASVPPRSLDVHEDGFVLRDDNKTPVDSYLWTEISEFMTVDDGCGGVGDFSSISTNSFADVIIGLIFYVMLVVISILVGPWLTAATKRLKVYTKDKKQFIFGQTYNDFSTLMDTVPPAIEAALTPEIFRDLEAGESIPFGVISVSATGIQKGKTTLTWDKIAEVQDKGESITIKAHEANQRAPTDFARFQPGLRKNIFLKVMQKYAPAGIITTKK